MDKLYIYSTNHFHNINKPENKFDQQTTYICGLYINITNMNPFCHQENGKMIIIIIESIEIWPRTVSITENCESRKINVFWEFGHCQPKRNRSNEKYIFYNWITS